MSNVQDLREYSAKLRAISATLVEKADYVDQRAAEVEATQSEIEGLLSGINVDVATVATHSVAPKGTGRRGRPKGSTNKPKTESASAEGGEGKVSLRKLILQILKENRGGMDLGSLVEECLKRGYKSKTKGSFTQIVYQNLHKMVNEKEEVSKAEDKKYRLVKAA